MGEEEGGEKGGGGGQRGLGRESYFFSRAPWGRVDDFCDDFAWKINTHPRQAGRQAGSPLSVISLPPLETPNDFSPDLSQQLLAVLAVFDRVWAGGGKNDGRIFQFRLDGGMVIRVSNRGLIISVLFYI